MAISYVSPRIEGRHTEGKGHGLFARESIAQGELLLVWGGFIFDAAGYTALTEKQKYQSIMVEEGLYLVNLEEDLGAWINHSCDPNAWLVGQISLFSRREIKVGEEICFDYGTCVTVSDPIDEFICQCGSPDCRGRLSADDWQDPAFQVRYAGHFMPYIQRKIDRQQSK